MIGLGGSAYLHQKNGTSTIEKKVVDVRTWATRWTLPNQWSWIAAGPYGGAVAQATGGQLATFDHEGVLLTTTTLSLTSPVQQVGSWLGNTSTGLRSFVGNFDDVTQFDLTYMQVGISTEEPRRYGGPSNQWALRGYFSNFNKVELITQVSASEIFNLYVRTFSPLDNSQIAHVSVPNGSISGVGQVFTWTLLGIVTPFLQPPFNVEVVRFDAANNLMAVKTLPGHPLHGWRYWQVTQVGPSLVRVETGGVDKPAASPLNYFAYYWTHQSQTNLWSELLTGIKNKPGMTWIPTQQDQEFLRGVWEHAKYEKNYILTRVCGSAPVPGVWVCQ